MAERCVDANLPNHHPNRRGPNLPQTRRTGSWFAAMLSLDHGPRTGWFLATIWWHTSERARLHYYFLPSRRQTHARLHYFFVRPHALASITIFVRHFLVPATLKFHPSEAGRPTTVAVKRPAGRQRASAESGGSALDKGRHACSSRGREFVYLRWEPLERQRGPVVICDVKRRPSLRPQCRKRGGGHSTGQAVRPEWKKHRAIMLPVQHRAGSQRMPRRRGGVRSRPDA